MKTRCLDAKHSYAIHTCGMSSNKHNGRHSSTVPYAKMQGLARMQLTN